MIHAIRPYGYPFLSPTPFGVPAAGSRGALDPGWLESAVNAQTGVSYTYLASDRGKLVTHSNAGAIAGTLPQAGTTGFEAGWFVWVQNRGAGTLTITPTTSTIDGAASLALTTGQGCLIVSDGSNYFTMRGKGGGINDGDTLSTGLTFPNAGLKIKDTDGSHSATLKPEANLTANRTWKFNLPDADAFVLPPGIVLPYAGSSAPAGWLLCDGSAVSRTTYADLFAAIGTTFGAGDGSTTFNLPDLRGRVPAGVGTGTLTEDVAAANVSTANDTFTVASNSDRWNTGMKVQVSTTGSLPGGLSAGTDYFVIRASNTTIKFATSLANAVAGTAIDLTSQGTGTHTVTHTLTARSLGDKYGADTHALTVAEMPSHTHTQDSHNHTQNAHNHLPGPLDGFWARNDGGTLNSANGSTFQRTGISSTANTTATNQAATATNQNTGGSGQHANTPPSLVLNYIIKV